MAYAGTVRLGEIVVSYECENCGTRDSYSQTFAGNYSNQRGNYIGPSLMQKAAQFCSPLADGIRSR